MERISRKSKFMPKARILMQNAADGSMREIRRRCVYLTNRGRHVMPYHGLWATLHKMNNRSMVVGSLRCI